MRAQCLTFANGKQIPIVGLGTWRSPPDVMTQVIKDAIDVGYRHFDCAFIYGNESAVGQAIEEKINECAVTREELFITSKLWCTFYRPDLVRECCERSLNDLKLTYFDNYLMHFPTAFKEGHDSYPKDEDGKVLFSDVDFVDTWRAMEQLVDEGLCHSIGLSNFNKRQICRILDMARINPVNLQIECHPYLNQKQMLDFCKENNIIVTCYSPLGSAHTPYKKPGDIPVLQHPKVQQIADNHNCHAAQVLLRYQVQRGCVVIPRSVNKSHMAANLEVCDMTLNDEEINELDSLDINGRIQIWTQAAGHPHHPFENDDHEVMIEIMENGNEQLENFVETNAFK